VTGAGRPAFLVSVFGLLLTAAVLAGAGALFIFGFAFEQGGGAVAGRWLTLLAVASIGAAVIVASRVESTESPSRRDLSVGIAGAGLATVAVIAVRALLDTGGVGPVDIAALVAGVGVVVASPRLASGVEGRHLLSRFASVANDRGPPPEAGSGQVPAGRGMSVKEWTAVVFGLVVLIAALAYVLPTGTLGHDESVYAVKARSWLVATPATGFRIYRPLGMPVVGWLVLHVSESEVALRIAATAIAVGAIITMWAIGRAMLGPVAAVVGTATFFVSESYLRRATEFLNDLASAGLLLVTIYFIWLHFERHPDRWWLLAAAPAAAAAYYVRYGSLFGLAVIAVVGGAIWFRRLAASWRQIAATVGLLIALLIPHFWYSQWLTGSVLGVFRAAQAHAAGAGGFGLDDYLRFFPERLAGTFGAVVMVTGFVFTIMLAIAARTDPRHRSAARTAAFLTITAVATTVLLGLFTHGEPRFIFLPLMALLLVGGQAVAAGLSRMSDVTRRIALAGLIVVVGYALVTGAGEMHNRLGRISASRSVIAHTGELVRADAGTDSCTVQSAYVPQVTWYSRCATYLFDDQGPPSDHAYLVLFTDSDRQPTTAQLEALLVDTNDEPIQVVPDAGGVYGDGYVYELVVAPTP
jgi:hypothetical protein